MPLGVPALRRGATQSSSRRPQDVLSVTDRILAREVNGRWRTPKYLSRHIGSVSGPNGPRRRLGRRRMTHVSEESSLTSIFGFGSWPIARTTESLHQFQWEAPSSIEEDKLLRPARFKLANLLDSVLCSVTHRPVTPEEDAPFSSIPIPQVDHQILKTFIHDLGNPGAAPENMRLAIAAFAERLEKDLDMGSMSPSMIHDIVGDFAKIMWIKTKRATPGTERQQVLELIFLFYARLWHGIQSCRILDAKDLGVSVFAKMLVGLNRHQLATAKPLSLSMEILEAGLMQFGLHPLQKVVLGAADGWLAANQAIAMEIKLRPEAIKDLESYFQQSIKQIGMLAEALFGSDKASNHTRAAGLIRTATSHMLHVCSEERLGVNERRNFVSEWLLMIARLPLQSSSLLISIWKYVEAYGKEPDLVGPIRSSLIMLEFWAAQGHVGNAALIRERFYESLSRSSTRSVAPICLIEATAHPQTGFFGAAGSIFEMFRKLGRGQTVITILRHMPEHGFAVHHAVIAFQIRKWSYDNPDVAWKMLKQTLRHRSSPLLVHQFPFLLEFAVANPRIHMSEIWGSLQLPRGELSTTYLPRLNVQQIQALRCLAWNLAHCIERPYRRVLRLVGHCAYLLRSDGTASSRRLSRAVCYAAITRGLTEGYYVGDLKLKWVLDLVQEDEGEDVAMKVDQAARLWREEIERRRSRLRRLGNPLQVGPTD